MIVTCPSCRRKYSVEKGKVPNGKKLKCSVCSSTWTYIIDDDDIQADAANIQSSRIIRRGDASAYKGGVSWFNLFLIFSFLSIAFGVYMFRDYVATYIPASRYAYDLIGLDYGTVDHQFEIKNINYTANNGKLVIEGDIVNPSTSEESVDVLMIKVISKDDHNLKPLYFAHKMHTPRLAGRKSAHFVTSEYDVPFNRFVVEVKVKDSSGSGDN